MGLIRDSRWVKLLREGRYEEFNRLAAEELPDLRNADLRMIDLRQANLMRADLRGAYMRNADLRELNLSEASLKGQACTTPRSRACSFPRR